MQKYPKVSIITPFFNSSHFPKTIESVLQQSYTNRERFIVNDFVWQWPICKSTASELNALFRWDSRVSVLHNSRPCSIPRSRNKALKEATGQYVSFLDHDDMWDKEKLSTQIDCMEENKDIAIVWTNALRIDQYGICMQKELGPISDEDIRKWLPYHIPFRTSSITVRKSVMDTIWWLDEEFLYCDDKDLILSSVNYGQIYNIEKPLTYYRWHGENISNKQAQWVSKEALKCIVKHRAELELSSYIPALLYHTGKSILSRDMKNFLRPYFMKILYNS